MFDSTKSVAAQVLGYDIVGQERQVLNRASAALLAVDTALQAAAGIGEDGQHLIDLLEAASEEAAIQIAAACTDLARAEATVTRYQSLFTERMREYRADPPPHCIVSGAGGFCLHCGAGPNDADHDETRWGVPFLRTLPEIVVAELAYEALEGVGHAAAAPWCQVYGFEIPAEHGEVAGVCTHRLREVSAV